MSRPGSIGLLDNVGRQGFQRILRGTGTALGIEELSPLWILSAVESIRPISLRFIQNKSPYSHNNSNGVIALRSLNDFHLEMVN